MLTGPSLHSAANLAPLSVNVSPPNTSGNGSIHAEVGSGTTIGFWHYPRLPCNYEGLLGFKQQPLLSAIGYERTDRETCLRQVREL